MLDKNTKLIVQGLGKQGKLHMKFMLSYGTKILAGVNPGKGGKRINGKPVYNTVKECLKKHNVTWSCLFVPAPFAKEAALEALDCGLNLIIITEHIPVHDTIEIMFLAKKKNLKVVGPNCPGVVRPNECYVGIMPKNIFKKGNVGVISRSGTLTYEIVNKLTENKIGQSLVLGIGGDPIIGTNFIEALEYFKIDNKTKMIVLIGEIGGDVEELTAEYLKKGYPKPIIAYIAGKTAPKGKTMGHAGAIISGLNGTAHAKEEALKKVGVEIASLPEDVIKLVKEVNL